MLRKVLVVCTSIEDYLVFIHIGKKVVIRNSTELRLVANMYEKVRGTTTDWMRIDSRSGQACHRLREGAILKHCQSLKRSQVFDSKKTYKDMPRAMEVRAVLSTCTCLVYWEP